jgi:hypothetical protein
VKLVGLPDGVSNEKARVTPGLSLWKQKGGVPMLLTLVALLLLLATSVTITITIRKK